MTTVARFDAKLQARPTPVPTRAVVDLRRFRAVQQATARTCLDWGLFHDVGEDDAPFQGVTAVVDDAGETVSIADSTIADSTIADSNIADSTAADSSTIDSTADAALARLGWRRIGMWEFDLVGRRSVLVERDPFWVATHLDLLDYPGQRLDRLPGPRSSRISRSRRLSA